MDPSELWTYLSILVLAGGGGYWLAKREADQDARIERLERELEATDGILESIQEHWEKGSK